MIQAGTRLRVLDNSGAAIISVIQVLGGRAKSGPLGCVVVASVKSIRTHNQLASQLKAAATGNMSKINRAKKGEVVHAVVVQTKKETRRADGSGVSFGENAAVLVTGVGNAKSGLVPRGSRILGPVTEELRTQKTMKIVSIAPMVV